MSDREEAFLPLYGHPWWQIVTMGDLADAVEKVTSVEGAQDLRSFIIKRKNWHPDYFPFVLDRIDCREMDQDIFNALSGIQQ